MTTLSKEDDLPAAKVDRRKEMRELESKCADLVAENERLEDQVLARDAELWGSTQEILALKAENERLKSIPMKYRRMAFNAKLQDEADKLRTALAAAIAREIGVMKLIAEVESKYFALLKEQDAESEKFKAEGDMYGWNFHTGLRSGAVQMHLNMTTLIKAIAKPRDDSALREMIAGVYEEVLTVIQPDDSYQDDWFKAKVDCCNRVRALAEKAKVE